MSKNSEFRAYTFIENSLKELGWNTKNPARFADGEVYTQHECFQNETLKKFLSKKVPENVITVKHNVYWIIEAKPEHKQLEQAIREAQEYCKMLNLKSEIAPLFSVVVGNDNDTYLVKNYFLYQGIWTEIEINDKKTTGLLSKSLAQETIFKKTPYIKEHVVPDDIYYQKAIKINEILHNGSINKNQRARVMATILLALLKDSYINRENNCFSIINELNSRAEEVLHEKNKREFIHCINIPRPPTPDNHIKFRKALLETIQELDSINIRSAMNSGTDILGRFYEQFLKYGNGAKEIGIVLTPRHITNFSVDVLNINSNDKVLDPACGTGGFLVSAFDKVKNEANEEELEKFKVKGIYGIEQDAEIVALALVNMIFRGDGKTNIEEGNCFTTQKFQDLTVSKVLMNPPFALKKGDEKEYKFIDFALSKISRSGNLLAIVPNSILAAGKQERSWRRGVLEKHTLVAAIKLPDDLFYPVGACTSIIILTAHVPHKKDNNVFYGIMNDGFMKKKGIMKKKNEGNLKKIQEMLKAFMYGGMGQMIFEECITCPLLYDKLDEWCPEAYVKNRIYNKEEIFENMKNIINNKISFEIANSFA